MSLAFTVSRAGVARVCSVVVVVGCVVTGCGEAVSTPQGPTQASNQQQCVQAVFDVLSGMIAKPFDNAPFQAFVTRYGTQSVTYNAYLDVFTSFYSLSADHGVPGAESRLRAIVARDCTQPS
jgi:hypothetical protein